MVKGKLREPVSVALAVLIALLLSVAYMVRSNGATPDSYEYMRGGTSLVGGQGYRSLTGQVQTVFPPAYPLLIGFTNLLTQDPIAAGRYVSMAASIASVVLIFLLGRAAFSGVAGVSAAFLLALLPLRLQSSVMVLSESTFLALALLGLLLWVVSESHPWVGFLSGLSLGAAYLTRPEGFLIFAVCAVGVAASWVRREKPLPSTAIRFTAMVIGFALISLPFWVHLRQHTGRWRLTGKADRNLAIASGRTAEVPFHELRCLDEDDREIVYPPTATSFRQHLYRVLLNLRTASQMLGDMASLFLVACLGLGVAAMLGFHRSRRTAIYSLASIVGVLLLTVAIFFVEYRMLLLPLALLILFAAAARSAGGVPPRDGLRVYRKVATLLLVLASLQFAAGACLLIAAPIGSPMDDVKPFLAAIQQEPDATGPIIGNYREPRALALATDRDCLDLPWEPLPRVLRYAAHHHASFLLLRGEDHPELASLAWDPVTTDQLRPLARVETGDGEERRVLQLYRVHATERVE